MSQAGLAKRPAFIAYQGFWRILDYLYPPVCIGCGKVGQRYCLECQGKAMPIPHPVCILCGEPGSLFGSSHQCQRCSATPPSYVALRSYAVFEGALREALHSLKYKKNISMGEVLCHPLIRLLHQHQWPVNLIVPVPLSSGRTQERGYNQSHLLAFPLALASRIPYSTKAIRRVRETATQVNLSAEERRKNVSGAFWADTRIVRGKDVLVIDDVATTGSTIAACSDALLAAGAKSVYGLTLARAIRIT